MKLRLILYFLLSTLGVYSQSSEFNKLKDEALTSLINNNYDIALVKINNALSLNQTNADAYYIRGNIYERKQLVENAKKDYLKAIQINPKHIEAMSKCAIIYGKQKDMNSFCYYANKACELGSNDACGMYYKFCK